MARPESRPGNSTPPLPDTTPKMKTPALLLAAFTLARVTFGGPPSAPPLQPAPPANPLSFLDGRLIFDFQDRIRWEFRENNFDFNDKVDSLTDDDWLLNRLRLGVTLKPVSWLKVYLQAQDSREYFSDRPNIPGQLGAEGDDAFDLRQAYVEISNYDKCPWGMTLGRQVLAYGDERLIGSADWLNTGRVFDAAKLRYQQKSWSLDAFGSTVASVTRGEFNQSDLFNGTENHRGQIFSGLYFSTTALSVQTTDLYVLHLHEQTGPRYQPTALDDTNFLTLGFRVKSKPGVFYHQPTPAHDDKAGADGKSPPPPTPSAPQPLGFDYDAELAFQTGEVRGLDLTAFAAHGGLGFTFDTMWTPRVGVEYNYASGDHDPLDGNIETFQNLFPSNHKFYGIMDVTAWQNMHQAVAGLSVRPCKTVTALVDYRAFFIASTDDVWYRPNGITPVRPLTPAARAADNYEGSQIEVVVTWSPKKYLQFQGGYAHFFAGAYLADTGASSDADFGYIQATITF